MHYVNNYILQFVYLCISVDAILYGHMCICVYTSLHFIKYILKYSNGDECLDRTLQLCLEDHPGQPQKDCQMRLRKKF